MFRNWGQGSAVKLPTQTINITSNTIITDFFFALSALRVYRLYLCISQFQQLLQSYILFDLQYNIVFILKQPYELLPAMYHTLLSITLGFHCYKSLSPTSITVHAHTSRKSRSVWYSEILLLLLLIIIIIIIIISSPWLRPTPATLHTLKYPTSTYSRVS